MDTPHKLSLRRNRSLLPRGQKPEELCGGGWVGGSGQTLQVLQPGAEAVPTLLLDSPLNFRPSPDGQLVWPGWSLPWKESYDKPRLCIKKQRHHFANKGPYGQSCGFSRSHGYGCESWTIRKGAAAAAKSLQSRLTLCDPIDGLLQGSVPGILQVRTLEWVAISFPKAWKWKMKEKSLSRVWLLATSWTAAYQAPPSMGFSRQEYWSGVPLPSPKERWTPENWCFWTVVLEKTLESPLDCMGIQPVNPKGNQPWIFTEGTDAEAETPILWPPYSKSWLIGEDPDVGEIEGKRRRGQQMMRWLDSITDSADMNLSQPWEIVEDRGAWSAAVHEVTKSWTQLSVWTTTTATPQLGPSDWYIGGGMKWPGGNEKKGIQANSGPGPGV